MARSDWHGKASETSTAAHHAVPALTPSCDEEPFCIPKPRPGAAALRPSASGPTAWNWEDMVYPGAPEPMWIPQPAPRAQSSHASASSSTALPSSAMSSRSSVPRSTSADWQNIVYPEAPGARSGLGVQAHWPESLVGFLDMRRAQNCPGSTLEEVLRGQDALPMPGLGLGKLTRIEDEGEFASGCSTAASEEAQ